ncbi:uncharacterized protein LOC110624598 isoform X2 [Manihot esculenta]|nr:uncharacterized protein LOC110624598 isoform X2 [Manihot esculenta]KAG8644897.1 hypothetical protein MANES_10G014600v8 [Manihot esculenta]
MRMDAAIDAMQSYGFRRELIVTTVKELLNVYGMDGWPFIEEASYRVLLDNMLEKVEEEEKKKGDSLPSSNGGDGSNAKASCAGPSSEVLLPTCSSEEAIAFHLQANADLGMASEKNNNKTPFTALQADTSEYKDINIDQCYREKTISNSRERNIGSPEVVEALPIRWRRPYHGWISSDDDEELVELTPAPLDETFAKILNSTDVSRKGKRRWDARRQDI